MTIYGPIAVPAERYIVFSDAQHGVMVIDETVFLADGAGYDGNWVSPTLNRREHGFIWTFQRVIIYYQADNITNEFIEASGDGGNTWPWSTGIGFQTTVGGQVGQVTQGIDITGDDLRIKFQMANATPFRIVGFRPVMIKRGRADIGAP